MRRKLIICLALGLSVLILVGADIIGWQDFYTISTPSSNPATGKLRIWADSTTSKFKCLTSTGTSCYFDSVGGGGSISSGSFSGLGVCSSSGALYLFTGTLLDKAYCDGSVWHFLNSGTELFPPTIGSFTGENASGCTTDGTNGGIYINCTTTSGTVIYYTAYPGSAFTRTIAFWSQALYQNYAGIGIAISDGTKMIGTNVQYNTGVGNSGYWLNSSYNPTLATACCTGSYGSIYHLGGNTQIFYLRFADDFVSTWTWSWSGDNVHWNTFFTQTRNTYLTPTQIGLLLVPQSVPSSAWFLSWK